MTSHRRITSSKKTQDSTRGFLYTENHWAWSGAQISSIKKTGA